MDGWFDNVDRCYSQEYSYLGPDSCMLDDELGDRGVPPRTRNSMPHVCEKNAVLHPYNGISNVSV